LTFPHPANNGLVWCKTAIPCSGWIALASTDLLAADRVGVECMGIDAG
jgi:hypothetical protein